jgi:AcrR family transcriptional regulator
VVVFAGQGDAHRSMSLLWRTAGSNDVRAPGPKPALNVDMVIDAAIALADADGMAGLSMRAVGERLGCTAMALYTYVPTKGELVDLMYDRALAELPTDYDLQAGWRSAVTSWAEDLWAFCLRHPWVLQVSQARPVLGPNEFLVLETIARILYETGLGARTLRGILGAMFHFVRGSAQTVAESRQAATATGVSDEEWWYSRSPLLAEVAPDFAERFPMATRIESERTPGPETESYMEHEVRLTFEVGLTVLLDGIEATINRAS